jgi:carbon-monoxide dehydrogenase medium subunit
VKPAPFRYVRPSSLEEALAILAAEGTGAKPLAGGQSLIPAMNFRLAQPAVLVDLDRLHELRGIRETGNGDNRVLHIGAMTRQADVERSPAVRERAPLVADVMPWIAHAQIRNRGTFGGSLAHADPAAELPAAMMALDARFRVRGPGGERSIRAGEFYIGLFATALAPDELLTDIEIPALPERTGCGFEEISRRHGDFALVGVCAVLTLDPDGTCARATVTLLSVGDGPVRASAAEAALLGRQPAGDAVRDAAEAVATRDIDPPADIHASVAYRRQLARVLTARALETASRRAGAR